MGLLAGCFDGGSDGIENPKVEFDLRGPDGAPTGAGLLRVYASGTNPMRDSVPLLTKAFAGGTRLELTDDEMDSLLSLKLGRPASALPDTEVSFNVVAVSGEREAFVEGFHYRRAGGKGAFAHAPGKPAPAGWKEEVAARINLQDAVLGFEGAVGGAGKQFQIEYVFIPGSPYHAAVKGDLPDGRKGGFRFERMSKGSYSLIGADPNDTLYRSNDTLRTEDTEFSVGAWDPITILD